MNELVLGLIGVLSSFLGSLLPGILNTSMVQIAVKDSKKNAQMFMYGALCVIFFQTYIALYFAKLIDQNAYIAQIINEVGLAIFVGLTIYFFTKKYKVKKQDENIVQKSRKKHFWVGAFMAVLNIFPILFYVFIGVTLSNVALFDGLLLQRLVLSVGTVIGAFFAFRLYVYFFSKSSLENHFIIKNINHVLGWITLCVATLNAYKIFIK